MQDLYLQAYMGMLELYLKLFIVSVPVLSVIDVYHCEEFCLTRRELGTQGPIEGFPSPRTTSCAITYGL